MEPIPPDRTRSRHASAVLGVAVTATAVVALAVGSGPAQAGTEHLVQTADSPSTGRPVRGGGTWITNYPSYYYLGRLLPGATFDDEETTPANWHFGRAFGAIDLCGWAMPGSMGVGAGTAADSCSADTRESLSHRLTIGRDFNQPAHTTDHGDSVPADTSCTMSYNYFHGSGFTANGGHWADVAGHPARAVAYRFTTRDGLAVVVDDPVLGWGFLPIGCVQRPVQLYNDND